MASILIVDDVKEIRTSIARTLRNNDHVLFEASNGLEAIAIIEKNKIDLIILDILMPGMGGVETLLELEKTNKIKIIIITGLDLPKDSAPTRLIQQLGVGVILTKPFKKKELLDAVNATLNN